MLCGPGPRIVLLEARRGAARRSALGRHLKDAAPARPFLLEARFEDGGIWAGLEDLLAPFLAAAERSTERAAPRTVERHAYELSHVFPDLQRRVRVAHSLTDISLGGEKTRNFAADHAARIVHGLIDFLAESLAAAPEAPPLALAWDSFDAASALVRRFVADLLRRQGEKLGLLLFLSVEPGAGEAVLSSLPPVASETVRLDLPADPEPPAGSAADAETEAWREARALEAEREVLAAPFRSLAALQRGLALWTRAQRPDKVLQWQALSLGIYNHFAFYDDARRFCDPVAEGVDELARQPDLFPFWKTTRWNLLGNVFNCLTMLGESERAREILEREALPKIDDPLDRARAGYAMAMLHGRYLPKKDFQRAEAYLRGALEALRGAPPCDDVYFLTTFLENGLAFVYHRAGRSAEAIELCRGGLERLDTHLPRETHRLHRSVLLYNLAQAHDANGDYEEAVGYFSAAMEMDPNYPDYYNERGSALLRLGRIEEAIRDYRRAIELSAPFSQAWANLGQAHRRAGDLRPAIAAYTRAIDLDPGKMLPFAGRAQCHEALGEIDAALADYTAALEIDPAQPYTLANRAVLFYETGESEKALADLDRAIELAPEDEDLRANRAIALEAGGRG